jgi:hypothetical protein
MQGFDTRKHAFDTPNAGLRYAPKMCHDVFRCDPMYSVHGRELRKGKISTLRRVIFYTKSIRDMDGPMSPVDTIGDRKE